MSWTQALDDGGQQAQVKDDARSPRAARPVATPVRLVQVDDMTVNDEVIDFN